MTGERTGMAVPIVAGLAALVTIGALVGALATRPRPAGPVELPPPAGSSLAPQCANGPCQPLARAVVRGDTLTLLADVARHVGRVRITGPGVDSLFETTISQLGATFSASSLSCAVGPVSACVISGTYRKGTVGEVFMDRAGVWSRAGTPFYASAGYLALRDIAGSAEPDVVTVQQDCGSGNDTECTSGRVFAEVFALSGESVGCTRTVTREDLLPGWPAVSPPNSQLRPCP